MGFLPRIGSPKNDYEKLNYEICKVAVGSVYEYYIPDEYEQFELQYDLHPDRFKKSFIEDKINELLKSIGTYSYRGAKYFREGYFNLIRKKIENPNWNSSIKYPIDHLIHSYLKPIDWDLEFSTQDLKEAKSYDNPSEFEHFLIYNTDLLKRHPEIIEMGQMLHKVEFLLYLKLKLASIESLVGKMENSSSMENFEPPKSPQDVYTQVKVQSNSSRSGENVHSRKSLLRDIIEKLSSADINICDKKNAEKLASYLVGDYEPNHENNEKLQIKVDNRQFKLLYDLAKKKFHPVISQKKIEIDQFLLMYKTATPFKSSSLSDAVYEKGHANTDKATPPKNHKIYEEYFK